MAVLCFWTLLAEYAYIKTLAINVRGAPGAREDWNQEYLEYRFGLCSPTCGRHVRGVQ